MAWGEIVLLLKRKCVLHWDELVRKAGSGKKGGKKGGKTDCRNKS